MIPPAPPDLLRANLQFAALHKTLVTQHLNPDASTQSHRSADPTTTAKSAAESLHAHRITLAKQRILLTCLSSLTDNSDHDHNQDPASTSASHSASSLPAPLADLTALITSLIQTQILPTTRDGTSPSLTAGDRALLGPSIASFRAQQAVVLPELQRRLTTLEHDLSVAAGVTSTDLLPSNSAHPVEEGQPSLAGHLAAQTARLHELQTETLPRLLVQATDALVVLLRDQAREARRRVRALEGRKHGAEGRWVVERARWLEGVAGAMVGKVGVVRAETERDVDFDGGVEGGGVSGGGVRKRLEEVQMEMERVQRRREVADEALAEYADAEEVGAAGRRGDGRVLRRLGLRYGEVEREVAEVKRDVERLMRRRERGRGVGEQEDEDETWIR